MARPFNRPRIKALEVGQSCTEYGDPAAIKRSANAFGKRNGRKFNYIVTSSGVCVTREPDPVADLPEAA